MKKSLAGQTDLQQMHDGPGSKQPLTQNARNTGSWLRVRLQNLKTSCTRSAVQRRVYRRALRHVKMLSYISSLF